MYFHSAIYIFFLFAFAIVYWLSPYSLRKYMLVFVSYGFYASFDYRFTLLLFLSTTLDFYLSHQIFYQLQKPTLDRRLAKIFLSLSIFFNVGLLFLFKYQRELSIYVKWLPSSFFKDTLFQDIGIPIGMSFYALQSISYLIDIYKRKIDPEKSFWSFAAYISFFPQLLSGPIQKADRFLKEFSNQKKFDLSNIFEGSLLIIYGLFLKVVIADNFDLVTSRYALSPEITNTPTHLIRCCLMFLQIYTDFAGYTMIALGSGLFLGFKMAGNFNNPLVSASPVEFWQRWHMTLTTWFKDYVFIPLLKWLRNFLPKSGAILIATLISTSLLGIWHHATPSFLAWGLLNGVLYLVYHNFSIFRLYESSIPKVFRTIIWFLILFTYGYTSKSEVFLDNITHLQSAFVGWGPVDLIELTTLVLFGGLLIAVEVWHDFFKSEYLLKSNSHFARVAFSLFLVLCILLFGSFEQTTFRYYGF